MALTENDVALISQTWHQLLKKDPRTYGIQFFQHVFSQHPEMQKKFFPFMAANDIVRLGTHGSKVVNSVGLLVTKLEEGKMEELVEEINEITRYHANLQVGLPNFKTMCGALVDFLSTVPGNELSPAGVEAWRKLMGFLMKTTETELKRIEHQKQQEQK